MYETLDNYVPVGGTMSIEGAILQLWEIQIEGISGFHPQISMGQKPE